MSKPDSITIGRELAQAGASLALLDAFARVTRAEQTQYVARVLRWAARPDGHTVLSDIDPLTLNRIADALDEMVAR